MGRQDEFACTITVDGVKYGTWDKHDGGAASAQDTKYRPGGLGAEKSLGGPKSVENVTVSRLYEPAEVLATSKTLMARVGRGRVVVSLQSLDRDGNAFGDPWVRSGTIIKVMPPNYDSNANGAAMLEMEISCDGAVA